MSNEEQELHEKAKTFNKRADELYDDYWELFWEIYFAYYVRDRGNK